MAVEMLIAVVPRMTVWFVFIPPTCGAQKASPRGLRISFRNDVLSPLFPLPRERGRVRGRFSESYLFLILTFFQG